MLSIHSQAPKRTKGITSRIYPLLMHRSCPEPISTSILVWPIFHSRRCSLDHPPANNHVSHSKIRRPNFSTQHNINPLNNLTFGTSISYLPIFIGNRIQLSCFSKETDSKSTTAACLPDLPLFVVIETRLSYHLVVPLKFALP